MLKMAKNANSQDRFTKLKFDFEELQQILHDKPPAVLQQSSSSPPAAPVENSSRTPAVLQQMPPAQTPAALIYNVSYLFIIFEC